MPRYSSLKKLKREVGYEHPAEGDNHCGICRNYRPPQYCVRVYGQIKPGDWCELFEKLEEDG